MNPWKVFFNTLGFLANLILTILYISHLWQPQRWFLTTIFVFGSISALVQLIAAAAGRDE